MLEPSTEPEMATEPDGRRLTRAVANSTSISITHEISTDPHFPSENNDRPRPRNSIAAPIDNAASPIGYV